MADAATELSKLVQQFAAYVRDEENRKQVFIGGSVLALLLVVLTDNPIANGVSSLFGSEPAAPQFTADGQPDFANYEDVFLGEDAQFVVTGTANVRDYPTSQGTAVIRTLQSDNIISARLVHAFDPSSQWYKLSDGGYVWGGNLVHIDEQSEGGGPTFPSQLHGKWSSMDTCRGADMDMFVTINEREVHFYESSGKLTKITRDERGNALYHLAMAGEGEQWSEILNMSLSANGLTLIIEDELNSATPDRFYHNPEAPCDRVNPYH